MMVDRRTLWRADRVCLAETIRGAGFRVLVPDLRGHGASRSASRPGAWTYDDLVRDTGDLVAFGRRLEPELPLSLLGHSLFGHTALGWLGRHPSAPVAAVVALAVQMWSGRWQARGLDGLVRRAKQHAVMAVATGVARLHGHVPVRRLGVGTADEPWSYWRSLARCHYTGRWADDEGRSYRTGLGSVRCPVLHVVSAGDTIYAHPADAAGFLQPLAHRELWRVGLPDGPTGLTHLRPDHMGLVTAGSSAPVWDAVADWLRAATQCSCP